MILCGTFYTLFTLFSYQFL